jgi:hypothetical protein
MSGVVYQRYISEFVILQVFSDGTAWISNLRYASAETINLSAEDVEGLTEAILEIESQKLEAI